MNNEPEKQELTEEEIKDSEQICEYCGKSYASDDGSTLCVDCQILLGIKKAP